MPPHVKGSTLGFAIEFKIDLDTRPGNRYCLATNQVHEPQILEKENAMRHTRRHVTWIFAILFSMSTVATSFEGTITDESSIASVSRAPSAAWERTTTPPAIELFGTLAEDLVVLWDGPPTGPPQVGVDYLVDLPIFPTNITLRTTEKDGERVQRWFIGINRDDIFDVAGLDSITTDWAEPRVHDVIVQVGTEPDAPLTSLNVIDIPAQSPNNWSSLRLALYPVQDVEDGYVRDLVRCQANQQGKGGRISGYVELLHDAVVVAHAIGDGADGPGTLETAQGGDFDLVTIPQGSKLMSYYQIGNIMLREELSGVIETLLLVFLGESPDLEGTIHIQGSGVSTGDILLGNSGIGGMSAGKVAVDGTLAGRIVIQQMIPDIFGEFEPVIQLGRLTGSVEIHDEQIGELKITGPRDSTGHILVDDGIAGNVTIHGPMSGDILANVDGDDPGYIAGFVVVDGEYNGNICGNNLPPGGPLPGWVRILSFGCEGRICGLPPDCIPAATLAVEPTVEGGRWLIDARQPHPIHDSSSPALQGIGSAAEPFRLTLDAQVSSAIGICWSLCDTELPVSFGEENRIVSIDESPGPVPGQYTYSIVLDRPLVPGQWTSIGYMNDCARYTFGSLPGDVNADGTTDAMDILYLIDVLNGVAASPFGHYSTDINRSGETNPGDILSLINVMNGAGEFVPWIGRNLPLLDCAGTASPGPDPDEPGVPQMSNYAIVLTPEELCSVATARLPVVQGWLQTGAWPLLPVIDALHSLCPRQSVGDQAE